MNLSKRDQVILVAVVSALVCVGIWFLLIRAQKLSLIRVQAEVGQVQGKLSAAERLKNSAERVQSDLDAIEARLAAVESSMASGDLYTWSLSTLNKFAGRYQVTSPVLQRPSTNQMTLFPDFPYRAVTIPLRSSGYFHDIGAFVADFENTFPFFMVQNLEITADSPGAPLERDEKLAFRMDVVALIKPDSSR